MRTNCLSSGLFPSILIRFIFVIFNVMIYIFVVVLGWETILFTSFGWTNSPTPVLHVQLQRYYRGFKSLRDRRWHLFPGKIGQVMLRSINKDCGTAERAAWGVLKLITALSHSLSFPPEITVDDKVAGTSLRF